VLAACGFAAVFSGASNTPLACSIMAIELFGWGLAPYVVVACYVSYLTSGGKSIYHSQKVEGRKHERFLYALSYLGELPRRFVNGKDKK
jgi:H+/Cl- antiporter ClcA